eukprot:6213200-Pleurochrysis_carterae.AAC.3
MRLPSPCAMRLPSPCAMRLPSPCAIRLPSPCAIRLSSWRTKTPGVSLQLRSPVHVTTSCTAHVPHRCDDMDADKRSKNLMKM